MDYNTYKINKKNQNKIYKEFYFDASLLIFIIEILKSLKMNFFKNRIISGSYYEQLSLAYQNLKKENQKISNKTLKETFSGLPSFSVL